MSSFTKGFLPCLENLNPHIPRRPETWFLICNLMLKRRDILLAERGAAGVCRQIIFVNLGDFLTYLAKDRGLPLPLPAESTIAVTDPRAV